MIKIWRENGMTIKEFEDFLGLVDRTNPVTHTENTNSHSRYRWDTTVTMSGSSFTVNEDLLRYVTYGRGIPIDELQKRAERAEIDTSDVQDFLDGIEVIEEDGNV